MCPNEGCVQSVLSLLSGDRQHISLDQTKDNGVAFRCEQPCANPLNRANEADEADVSQFRASEEPFELPDLLSVWGQASVTFVSSPSGCDVWELVLQHLTFLVKHRIIGFLCLPAGCMVHNFSVHMGQERTFNFHHSGETLCPIAASPAVTSPRQKIMKPLLMYW